VGLQLSRLSLYIAVALLGADCIYAQTTSKAPSNVRQKSKASDIHDAGMVSEARRSLKELGYWVNADGPLKEASLHHALIAFQKIESRPLTGVLTEK